MQSKATAFFQRSERAFQNYSHAKKSLVHDDDPSRLTIHWSNVLAEFRKFIRFSEQTARNLEINAWADALSKEIKADDALQYLFHARNADEHGVQFVAESQSASLNIGNFLSVSEVSKVTIKNCSVVSRLPNGDQKVRRIDGDFSALDGRITDGWLRAEVPVQRIPAHLLLGEIVDRGKKYSVPSMGCRPEELAFEISQKGYDWMIDKREKLKIIMSEVHISRKRNLN